MFKITELGLIYENQSSEGHIRTGSHLETCRIISLIIHLSPLWTTNYNFAEEHGKHVKTYACLFLPKKHYENSLEWNLFCLIYVLGLLALIHMMLNSSSNNTLGRILNSFFR